MTPKSVYSTGITLRCQTFILLSTSCLCLEVPRHLKLSSPQNTISSRLPTVQRVHCISCLRAWHNHPTHHTLDSSLFSFILHHPHHSSPTPTSVVFTLLNISQICHYISGPHISHLDYCHQS